MLPSRVRPHFGRQPEEASAVHLRGVRVSANADGVAAMNIKGAGACLVSLLILRLR